MCYAIPGKVERISGNSATIDYFGEKRSAFLGLAEGISEGDYVYAQGGFVVQKVGKKHALENLGIWKELLAKLKKIDEQSLQKTKKTEDRRFDSILENALAGNAPDFSETTCLLETEDETKLEELFKTANSIRNKKLQNSCCVHGIIEFSNFCRNDCAYCGIRNGNEKLQRYRMSIDEIVSAADYAVNKLGFKALMLQSGEDSFYTEEKLVEIVEKIRKRCGAIIFLSVGEIGKGAYKKLYAAGARGVLMRFETSNAELYARLHNGAKLDDRLRAIREVSEMGYVVATGSLVGLPNQTKEDLANDILLAKKLNAEMFSFGPFIPTENTPLEGKEKVPVEDVLKVLAVARLVSQDAKILITTALETIDENGARKGLLAGANSLMINVTPEKYRKLYRIYDGKEKGEGVKRKIAKTIKLLNGLGRAPTDWNVASA